MLSKNAVTARQAVIAGLGATGLLALGGCSLLGHLPFHHHQPAVETPAAPPSAVSSEPTAATGEPQTALDEVTAPATATAIADTGTTTVITDVGPELKATAPKSYAVKRGDTLWGIANMFLRDPLTWPEIWYVNPQIENPHRIYPGDSVRLALGTDGHTQLQVVRRAVVNMGGPAVRLEPLLRSSPLDGPIASIPYSVIASFLTHPGVLTREEVKGAPVRARARAITTSRAPAMSFT